MIDALQIAQKFHDTYERLAPLFGYETRAETKQFDPESPNGKLMIAVCAEIGRNIELEAYFRGFDAARSSVEVKLPPYVKCNIPPSNVPMYL